jgi:hypothetical protein
VAWLIWLHGPAGLFENKQFAEHEFARRNQEYPDKDRKLRPLIFGDTTPPAAQPAPVQEPVAWIWKYANGEEEVVFVPPRHVDATHVDAPSTITPLYTAPPAAQRQWVDMPELELLGAYEEEQQGRWGDHVSGLLNVQAKLKEKNT